MNARQKTPNPYKRPCWNGECTEKGRATPGFCRCKADTERIAELEAALRKMRDDLDESECFPTTCAMIANKIDDLLSNRDD